MIQLFTVKFARHFPFFHKNRGKETYFVEQILNSLGIDYHSKSYLDVLIEQNENQLLEGTLTIKDLRDFWFSLDKHITCEKIQTIRDNKYLLKITAGNYIEPCVWRDEKKKDVLIQFAPYSEVIQTSSFNVVLGSWWVDNFRLDKEGKQEISTRDGLNYSDMNDWFKSNFAGIIIKWK